MSQNRDISAAKAFFRKAFRNCGEPMTITLDAYAASHRAVTELKENGELYERVRVRSCKYLNNIIEQDHRRIKRRIQSMQEFKRFDHAVRVLSGIELVEKIKKGQYRMDRVAPEQATLPEIWDRVLAA